MKIEAFGENGHASTPWKGKNALTGLLALIEKLELAECGQVEKIRALNKLMPHATGSERTWGSPWRTRNPAS